MIVLIIKLKGKTFKRSKLIQIKINKCRACNTTQLLSMQFTWISRSFTTKGVQSLNKVHQVVRINS